MSTRLERFRTRPWAVRTEKWARLFGREAFGDRITGLGAEIAFWWFFTLFPAMLAAASVLGWLDALFNAHVESQVEDSVIRVLSDYTGSAADSPLVSSTRAVFDSNAAGAFLVGLFFALWATSRAFTAMINALDVVYEVEDQRPYWTVRALGFALAVGTVLVGSVAGAFIIVGPLYGRGADIAADLHLGGWFGDAWDYVRVPLAAVLIVAWIAALFVVAPNHRTSWRSQLPGAIVTAGLWIVASAGFRIYLELAGGRSVVFGLLGGMLTLMLWMYLLALGILAGGEINSLRAIHGSDGPTGRAASNLSD